ncbi:protease complex subunit PrcB family protein [Flavobacterium sp. LHD-80]|uniref:protease complex subunit PrcB family protein n=1 Tax=Flavobacterium sp. LHD-80 TaxID=3071411 RepID=UPI0027DFFD71|nr:protease complex subunit PrcB family protein [Flavobacterium sp. LHD-80]MDQ6471224.1 protease complex subunit PrcB family protein [Flavobacterium sp. LHD-80]
MKHIITLLCILLMASSCSNDDSASSQISFSEITKESFTTDKKMPKSNLVIKDVTAWNSLLSKISPAEVSNFKETNIDFSKYQIIAVIDMVYGNGGHTIDITKITQNSNAIIIKVENLRTGDLTSVITQPYHIVKIAKSKKTVIFK